MSTVRDVAAPEACASPLARSGHRPFRLSPLAAAVAAVVAQPAFAQPEGGKALEEIVVTGTKRELNLQDVAQSITAFSAGTIEKMAFEGMDDYMKALPSASLTNSMPGRNAISMRGISTGSTEYRTDSQVSVYLDEQPVTSISQHLEIHAVDIERIEALPGPQGTLFGSSSQSGTLRIITNKPNHDGFSGQVDADVATTKDGDPSYGVNGHLNIPISESFAIRVVGYTNHEGGYVDNVVGPDLARGHPQHGSPQNNQQIADSDVNEYEYLGGRVRALWDVNEQWSVDLAFQIETSEADGTWESDPYLGDYKITRFHDEWRDDDWWQTAITIKGDLGFAQLVSATSYFDRESSYEWDNMAYNQWQTSYYGNYGVDRYQFEYEFGSIFNEQTQDRVTQEIRLTSQGESKLDWMVGAFYEDVHDWWDYGAQMPNHLLTPAWQTTNDYACYYEAQGYDVPCPLPPTDKIYDQRYDNKVEQIAAFGELTWHITPKWRVTGGARWFEFDREREQIYTTPEGKPPTGSFGNGEGVYQSQGSDSAEVFKFATQYQVTDDLMLYALYSEGYRLGGENGQRAAATGRVPETYDPDTMTNYEAGLKSEWFDNSLQFNATLFLMEWDDIQLNRSARPWWLRGTFNGDGGESKGLEFNWIWRATENLTIDGSAFLAEAEYTGETFGPTGAAITTDGQKMPNGPEEKLRFGVEYNVTGVFGLPGDLRIRYDSTYTGEMWDNIEDSYAAVAGPGTNRPDRQDAINGLIPESWHSNLQFSYDSGQAWEVNLLARNVWDNQGITNIVRGSNYIPQWFGDPRFQNERTLYRPRTVSLGLKVKF